jgi:hypothetical protein
LYAGDTWKANSKWTLNYGLRWEPYLPEVVEAIFNFNEERFRQGIKSTVFLNAPAGFSYRGDPGFLKNAVNTRWLQFAPRVGLAWDVAGDGRTSVRASYGLGYVHVPGTFRETYSGSPPWGGRVILTNPLGGLDDPWRGIPGGNIFPYELDKNAPFPAAGLFYTQPTDLRNPYSQSWNLSVQRQLGAGWLVSGTYMGSNNLHLWGNNPVNPALYFPQATCTLNGVTYTPCSSTANTEARRRLTLDRPEDGRKISYFAEADDGGTQSYHGMLLSVERRATSGVTVGVNYTLSHCIGDYASLYNPMAMHVDNTYVIPNNRRYDRGNCDTDRRHIFNLTAVAETPQFSNPTVRAIATGWRWSGIYRKSAGSLLPLLAGNDRALNGLEGSNPNQRPTLLSQSPYRDRSARPLSGYLNPAAFAQPDIGTLGNTGRNAIQGPGTWAFDMSISRTFQFRERQRLELRAEAYNVTNSFRPGNPNATLNNANFGVIRTSQDPRILQFALKYVF